MQLSVKQTAEEFIRVKCKAIFDAAMHDKTGAFKKQQAIRFHAEILNKKLHFFTIEKK